MNRAIEKEQRQESILLSLKKLDYLTRSQIQVLHGLKSARNAQRVMKELETYVSHFRDGENVYYLNSEGRERVSATKIRKKTIQAKHFIMRNSIYIGYGSPSTWRNEIRLGFKEEKKTRVVCDALFQQDKRYHIVEADHTQKMSKNRIKIEKYRRLIELGFFETKPCFIWITTTEFRRKQLTKLLDGLDYRIFTVNDFH
ncbi:replication-relaxation family protein [Priestia aryabhattai]|uniref:replication-relaxation family protein n=1 Tax=Priestia aryabhattai TaxID=412384 RepID=UPI002E222926|nr:replication-relaxation family protein [Priestia aryabhattai]